MRNIDNRTLVIIWLSLQLSFVSYRWLQAEKRVSFLEGVQTTIDNNLQAEYQGCMESYGSNKGYYDKKTKKQ